VVTLSESDVQRLLDPAKLIDALDHAFRQRHPTVAAPVRTHMDTEQGIFLVMPCYDRSGHGLGMKLIMVSDHATAPEGKVKAHYLLIDPASGRPRLMMGASHLTGIRTAATSALATRYLARQDSKVLGVFGTRRQARAHLHTLRLVRKFEQFLVCGSTPNRTREFAQEMSVELGVAVQPVDAATCAATSDVLCTCTSSAMPLFPGGLIRAGTHINAIGAFQPHKRELDSDLVERSRVLVEAYDAALAEPGDLLIPIGEGRVTYKHIQADLHELTAGKKQVRASANDITLFKSVGHALEDLVAAEMVEAALAAQ
jgi:ornithine cyclodeaminase/alanine dehydrogenase-like protein (mu-crystallin family)